MSDFVCGAGLGIVIAWFAVDYLLLRPVMRGWKETLDAWGEERQEAADDDE